MGHKIITAQQNILVTKSIMQKFFFELTTFLLLATITISNLSCDKVFGEDEEIPDTYLNASQQNAIPYKIISLWSDEGIPADEEFTGTFGELEITVCQTEPALLHFMIPDVNPGSYNLTINFGDYEGYTDLTIELSQPISNPDEIVNNVITGANQSLQFLESVENQTGQQVSEHEKLFITNTISEMNSVFATLSTSEKQEFASFIIANPELFGFGGSRTIASGEILEGFRDFMKTNMLKIMIAGGSFYLSFTAPEPTGLTKIIALASGVYLVKKVLELGMTVLEIYDASVVAEQSELTAGRSELVFLNHEEIMFDVKVTYRTIYKEDINTTIPLLQEVISLIHNYLDYRDKIDGYIIKFKSLFNISGGGLNPGPNRVSEIQTTTSNEIDGDGNLVNIIDINNTNVKVAITGRDVGWIIARFSTCEDEYQNFNFTYTYDDPVVDDKGYEAMLIATEIIYHEITDGRDGKVYNTIDIGNQTWFAENLNYWGEDGNLGLCDSNDLTGEINGRYYDFYDAEEACPPGWHLPSDDEWTELELALGMDPTDVDKYDNRGEGIGLASILKSCDAGWIGWNDNNEGINSIGFSIKPSSHIYVGLGPYAIGGFGHRSDFWSSTSSGFSGDEAYIRSIHYSQSGIRKDDYEKHYFQLTARCVKD